MDVISFHSFWTVVTVVAFVLLVIWAWSGSQKHAFNKASRIPLEDDAEITDGVVAGKSAGKENDHE